MSFDGTFSYLTLWAGPIKLGYKMQGHKLETGQGLQFVIKLIR